MASTSSVRASGYPLKSCARPNLFEYAVLMKISWRMRTHLIAIELKTREVVLHDGL